MVQKTMESLRDKLGPALAKFSENPAIKGIQQGFMSTMSVLIIGGIATLLSSPPGVMETATGFSLMWHQFAANYAGLLAALKMSTMDFVSLWTLIGITMKLSKILKQDAIGNTIIAGMLFMIFTYTAVPGGLAVHYFGSLGLFTAMVTAVFTVYFVKFLKDKNVTINFPDTVPEMVAQPFQALVPAVFAAAIAIAINVILGRFGINFPSLVVLVFQPLVQFTDSFFGVLLIAFLVHFLWSLGIHGGAVVMPIAMPVMMQATMENMEAISSGAAPVNIFTVGFYGMFIMPLIGLAIAILMVAKSTHLKTVGKVGFIPMLFNITEPIGFGAPVILNPPLAIARILSVLVTTSLGYAAFAMHLVKLPSFQVPMFLPGFITALLATTDWKAIILWLAVMALSTLIYIPFVKMYDTQLLNQEKAEEAEANEAVQGEFAAE